MSAVDRIKKASPLIRQTVAMLLDRLAADIEDDIGHAEGKRGTGEYREHLEDQLGLLADLEELLIGQQLLLGVDD